VGRALTNDLCSQNVKIKVKVKIKTSAVFDFDFNILTAFIRLGRARPVRGGVPSIYITIGTVSSILLFDINRFVCHSYKKIFALPPVAEYIFIIIVFNHSNSIKERRENETFTAYRHTGFREAP
jgi:hypothetical protein